MKKLLFIVAAIAMMATTACTTDESAPVNSEALVSFTIDAPELQTRVTDGNGDSTNRLQYAFYDAEGKHLPELNGVVENFVGSTTIQIALVEGCSYSALFWADNTAAPYKLDLANKTMKIDATNINGNSDKNDAFYKYETNIDPVEKTRKVELTRPFAQINIATADTAKAANAGFSAVTTEVTVTTHSSLNLATGAVADNDYKTFTYTFATLPTAPGTAKVNGKDYDMLAMNYILVNERELIDITMKVSEEIDGTNPVERKYTTVPVQRNYRTYIVGNLLTTENEFNTMITADWLEDEIYDTNIIVDKIDVENDKTGDDTEVTLKAKEDWTAKVVFEATRSTEGWCTVEPTNGVAGETTLTISTEPNDTGKDRTATVVIKSGESTREITVKQLAIVTSDDEEATTPANNEIWYTSTDGNIVKPTDLAYWYEATIISNTYENGKGVIKFDRDLTQMGPAVFYDCDNLTSITLPESLTDNIGYNILNICNNLKAIYGKFASEDNKALIINGLLQAYAIGCTDTSYTIPSGVTTIGHQAFAECNSLENITIPDGVTDIDDNAFAECSNLQNITIPNSVIEIGVRAFAYCSNLESITIPNKVTEIVARTFLECSNLKNVTIPESVTKIGNEAFSGCGFQSIKLPDNLTEIGQHAFFGSNISSITIPEKVTTVGNFALRECFNLTKIYCKPTTPPNGGMGLISLDLQYIPTIYVPAESLEAYKTAEGWKDYTDYIFAAPSTEGEDDEEYVDKIGDPDFQAAIGNNKFATLQEALNVVEDNQTITLLNRIDLEVGEVLKIYRSIDFTLDLNGYRIHSYGKDGSVTAGQYVGMIDINTSKSTDVKDATITIKNGFLTYDGKTMIGVSGSTDAKTVVNLENVTISGAIDAVETTSPLMGSAIVIGHSNVTVNLKNGTKISNDREVASSQVNVTHSPLVEVCCGTLNIYDGVEFIYNYVEHANNLSPRQMVVISNTAGHTNTAVVNVYGGYGRVAGSCFTMGHNGGLFNIYGGEWIANTDGSMPKPSLNSGYAVQDPAVVALDGPYGDTSQNIANIANIYGGILRGRFHCGWSRGSGDPAQLYISGGNFNADPTQYVVEGHTATQNSQGYWEVYED